MRGREGPTADGDAVGGLVSSDSCLIDDAALFQLSALRTPTEGPHRGELRPAPQAPAPSKEGWATPLPRPSFCAYLTLTRTAQVLPAGWGGPAVSPTLGLPVLATVTMCRERLLQPATPQAP